MKMLGLIIAASAAQRRLLASLDARAPFSEQWKYWWAWFDAASELREHWLDVRQWRGRP